MGVFWDLLLATYPSTSKNVNMIHQLIKTISKILQTIQQCTRFGLGWNLLTAWPLADELALGESTPSCHAERLRQFVPGQDGPVVG